MRKLILSVVAALVPGVAMAQPNGILAHWVQMAPGGTAEARIVVDARACPSALLDGTSVPMRERAAPDEKFPVHLCSVTLNANMQRASVLGVALTIPPKLPERILVLGDTGCRIKGATVQACNDPAQWPFPQVAAQAAKMKPDLVIHVGDYLYRESACPNGNAGCQGSPWGDNWTTWAADFFTPGKPLLEAAPWVIVRGNHEECARAGAGFLRLLGPLAFVPSAPCTEHVAPYTVPLGAANLVVMDNANAVDRGASSELVDTYRQDFRSLAGISPKPAWLAMHHPIWGVARFEYGIVAGGNTTLEDAEDSIGIPATVDLMLAGHIHTFEAINYERGLPPQLIVGEGGDLLNDAPPNLSGQTVGNAKISNGFSLPGYGFLLMTHEGDHWTVDVFNAAGERERNCTVAARSISCGKS